jgi:hypothetical protein
LPYEDNANGGSVRKFFGLTKEQALPVYVSYIDKYWVHNVRQPNCKYTTKEEAMKAADDSSIKLGWKILTKEQAEKLKILL